ncbi:MAG TPA: hypothetical protein VGF73_07575 [Chthoniobacterales bacterium]|jgi:homoserine O-acetyltransferase
MKTFFRPLIFFSVIAFTSFLQAADYPLPNEGDFTLRGFHFTSGAILPELRLHYRTLGKPLKNE